MRGTRPESPVLDAPNDSSISKGSRSTEEWKARDVGIELKRNSKPADTALGQAVQDVQDRDAPNADEEIS